MFFAPSLDDERRVRRASTLQRSFAFLGALSGISAICSWLAIQAGIGPMFALSANVGAIVAILCMAFSDSDKARVVWACLMAALFGTGMGFTIEHYLELPHGHEIVFQALAVSVALFLSLSAYAAITGKNFGFLGAWLFSGLVVTIAIGVFNIFFKSEAVSLTRAALGVVIFSGYTLFDVSRAVNDPDASWIDVGVNLYLDLANLFMDLLKIMAKIRD